MQKRQNKVILIAVLLTAVLAASTTIAFMFSKSKQRVNEFATGIVTCDLKEKFDGDQKSSITVKNTGNTEAYIRINFATHWVDQEDHIVGEFLEMPVPDHDPDWIANGNTYYYKYPVAKGASTGEFFHTPLVLQTKTVNGKELYQVVEVFAEAIQSKPANAVSTSWNAVLSENGEITGIRSASK